MWERGLNIFTAEQLHWSRLQLSLPRASEQPARRHTGGSRSWAAEAAVFKWKVKSKEKTQRHKFHSFFKVDMAPLFNMLWMINCYLNSILALQFLLMFYFFSRVLHRQGAGLTVPGQNSHQASSMIHSMFHPQYQKSHSAWPFVFVYFEVFFFLVCKVSSCWKKSP